MSENSIETKTVPNVLISYIFLPLLKLFVLQETSEIKLSFLIYIPLFIPCFLQDFPWNQNFRPQLALLKIYLLKPLDFI